MVAVTQATAETALLWAPASASRCKAETCPRSGAAFAQYAAFCTPTGLTVAMRHNAYGHGAPYSATNPKYPLVAATAWCCGVALYGNGVAETGGTLPGCFAHAETGYYAPNGAWVPAPNAKQHGGTWQAQAGTQAGTLASLRVVYVLPRKPAARPRKGAKAASK